MDRRITALLITLLLLAYTANCVNAANADSSTTSPRVVVESPQPTVYHNSTIELLVRVTKLDDETYPQITSIMYSLNGSNMSGYKFANYTYIGLVNLPNSLTGRQYIGNATIEGIKEGNYTLRILYGSGTSTSGSWVGSGVNFRVRYDNYEPATLLSPANQTYHNSNIPLRLAIKEPYVYAYYRLNNGNIQFINKTSSTLSAVPLGNNNLSVFVKYNDIHSIFFVSFTVDSKEDNLAIVNVSVVIVVAVAAIVALLAITMKRKKALLTTIHVFS